MSNDFKIEKTEKVSRRTIAMPSGGPQDRTLARTRVVETRISLPRVKWLDDVLPDEKPRR